MFRCSKGQCLALYEECLAGVDGLRERGWGRGKIEAFERGVARPAAEPANSVDRRSSCEQVRGPGTPKAVERLAPRLPDSCHLRSSLRRVTESCLRSLPSVARNRKDPVRFVRGDLAPMSVELLDERGRDLDGPLDVSLGTPVELRADLNQRVLQFNIVPGQPAKLGGRSEDRPQRAAASVITQNRPYVIT